VRFKIMDFWQVTPCNFADCYLY